ncbi:DUF6152 family protein [Candidatus Rariloculus sp.]|uniref:DUF6152 family protein n=1 Tax=Candidatus Rariloculus sp. TaxID=3101265 RepID=UPI003D149144
MKSNITWVAAALLFATTATGHHSDAALDMNAVATFEGTVSEYSMRNPHSYFTVDATGEDGAAISWTVQLGSAISIRRRGWTADSLVVGDEVSVGVHPARDGRTYGLLVSLEKGGEPLSYERSPSRATASTTTLEGRWIVDRDSLGDDYPGGLDQLMARELSLTEKGRAAYAAFDQNSEENPELACLSKPTPGGIVYTDIYPMEIEFLDGGEIIMIRSQYFDQERTVFMDGRPHPRDERTHEGHSIGRWEDDVLVVDTANFADDRSPYQNGVPSGAQKHVVERYWLHPDGTRLRLEFTLEDPEYIVGSMTHARDLVYSPQLDMAPFNCDLEATRRFLPR